MTDIDQPFLPHGFAQLPEAVQEAFWSNSGDITGNVSLIDGAGKPLAAVYIARGKTLAVDVHDLRIYDMIGAEEEYQEIGGAHYITVKKPTAKSEMRSAIAYTDAGTKEMLLDEYFDEHTKPRLDALRGEDYEGNYLVLKFNQTSKEFEIDEQASGDNSPVVSGPLRARLAEINSNAGFKEFLTKNCPALDVLKLYLLEPRPDYTRETLHPHLLS